MAFVQLVYFDLSRHFLCNIVINKMTLNKYNFYLTVFNRHAGFLTIDNCYIDALKNVLEVKESEAKEKEGRERFISGLLRTHR